VRVEDDHRFNFVSIKGGSHIQELASTSRRGPTASLTAFPLMTADSSRY
jgi:hypothetical protein